MNGIMTTALRLLASNPWSTVLEAKCYAIVLYKITINYNYEDTNVDKSGKCLKTLKPLTMHCYQSPGKLQAPILIFLMVVIIIIVITKRWKN